MMKKISTGIFMSVAAVIFISGAFYFYAPRCISGNCQNGCGVREQRNAFHYKGCFVNGRAHGRGVFTAITGDSYAGEWQDGLKSGQGRQIYANGSIYTGTWKRGKRQGYGQFTGPDGRLIHSGEWQADLKVE